MANGNVIESVSIKPLTMVPVRYRLINSKVILSEGELFDFDTKF